MKIPYLANYIIIQHSILCIFYSPVQVPVYIGFDLMQKYLHHRNYCHYNNYDNIRLILNLGSNDHGNECIMRYINAVCVKVFN